MKRIVFLLTVVMISMAAFCQQSTELKLNLEKNKLYRLSLANQQTIIQTVNGNQQTIETSSSYTISFKMLDATSSFEVVEIHLDTISTNTNTMGKLVKMSSLATGDIKSSESSEIMSYVMSLMSKNPLFAKIDFSGKVLEIVNIKMVSDHILKDTASLNLTGPVAVAIKKQMISMVSEDAYKSIIEGFTRYLPGKSVAIGDKWNIATSTHAGGMDLDVSTTSQLKKLEEMNATLDVESNINAAANSKPMDMGGAKISYDDLKGIGISTIVLDAKSGLLKEGSSNTHITGNLGVSAPGVSMQIPMDITSNAQMKRLQ